MNSAVTRLVAVEVRRRCRTLILVGLVAGLIGGVVISSFAGARRTSTAYDRLVEASDFPDAFVQLVEPRPGLAADIAGLRLVEGSVEARFVVGRHREQRNQLLLPVQTSATSGAESVIVRGRPADPRAADEVVVSENLAGAAGFEVGDIFPYQALTDDEFADLLRDRWAGTASGATVDLRIVGITRSPIDSIVSDFPTLVGTPAFGERVTSGAPGAVGVSVHLRDGADASALRADIETLRGGKDPGRLNGAEVTDFLEKRRAIDEAVTVLAIGMLVFGSVAALAGVVVVAQLVSRTMERVAQERRVLKDLGLGSRDDRAAAVLPGLVAVAVAVVTSVALAVGLSRFTPIGVARNVEPTPGTELNLAFLGLGAVAVALLTLGVWVISARRSSPETNPRRVLRRSGSLAARVGAMGGGLRLPVAAMLAFGHGHRSPARRLAFLGVAIGVAGVVAASIFGASLERLASDPARWGWVGDQTVEVPDPVRDDTYAALDAAEEVEAYAEVQAGTVTVEGRAVDAYRFDVRRGTMTPTLLAGRAPAGPGEIALGPALVDDLDVEVGDLVDVDDDRVRVVGSVLTFGQGDRSGNTEGVIVGGGLPETSYTAALVRFVDGIDTERAAEAIYGDLEYGPPVRPAEVTNLAALRALPPLLALALATVGTAAVVHTAVWMAARSRRDLAVLRALGLRRGRARSIVTAAAATIVITAAAFGGAVGIVVGRTTWTVVAGSTDLATDVCVPPLLFLVAPVVAGAAWTLGAWSGRRAVRSHLATLLRAE